MILQALDTIHVSSVSSENITTGQTFEVDDLAGRSLIERGLAIEVDMPAKVGPVPSEPAEPAEQAPISNKSGAGSRTKAA